MAVVASRRSLALLVASLGLVACKGKAPEALEHLPADAHAVIGAEIGAVAQWEPIAAHRARFLGDTMDGLLEAAESCDVGLAEGRLLVGWNDVETRVVVEASRIGESDRLRCLTAHEKLADTDIDLDTEGDATLVTIAALDLQGKAASDDILVLRRPHETGTTLEAPGDGLRLDSEALPLSHVDFRRPVWAALGQGAVAGRLDAQAIAISIALDDDEAEIDARAIRGEGAEASAETLESEARVALRSALAAVYMPSSIAGRMEVDVGDEHADLSVELAPSELYALDLRFMGDDPPKGRRDGPTIEEALAAKHLLDPEDLAVEEVAVMVADAKAEAMPEGLPSTGVPECDEYLRKYFRCIETKMPAAARDSTRDALTTTAEAWRDMPASSRETLASTCSMAMETVSEATAAMGCEF